MRRLLLATVFALAGAMPAAAEYPTKPIRMLVPYGPGGATDIVARILGGHLGKLRQPVVVENKPGAAAGSWRSGRNGAGARRLQPADVQYRHRPRWRRSCCDPPMPYDPIATLRRWPGRRAGHVDGARSLRCRLRPCRAGHMCSSAGQARSTTTRAASLAIAISTARPSRRYRPQPRSRSAARRAARR